VLAFSLLIAIIPLVSLILQKGLGASAKAQMIELINDELGVLAALLGTIFISLGYPLADPIATMIVATIIAINAVGIFRENLGLVIGKSPDPAYLEKIRQIAASSDGVLEVVGLMAEYIGPDSIHVDLEVRVSPGITIEDANEVVSNVRRRVLDQTKCIYCSVRPRP
jgi:cation diffusion facilitator family transporter